MDIISIVKDTGLDGIIATNTTINRENLKSNNKNETGGLSGKPLASRSTEVIKFISQNSNKTIPKINIIKLPNIQKLRFNASSKMYWQKYSYSMYTRLVKRVEEIRHLLRVELELELNETPLGQITDKK